MILQKNRDKYKRESVQYDIDIFLAYWYIVDRLGLYI